MIKKARPFAGVRVTRKAVILPYPHPFTPEQRIIAAIKSARVSTTATVSVVGITPLTPGVTYTLRVVGENSRGQGPESNHITFTA